MVTHPNIRTRKSASGFSLIEVLIALAIISIGLLGIAALFVQMLKFNGSGIYRVRAVMHAADMADRIRANPDAKTNFNIDDAVPDDSKDKTCHATSAVTLPDNCSVAELAGDEIYHWKERLQASYDHDLDNTTADIPNPMGLPGGIGAITYTAGTATTPATYLIVVTWDDLHDPAGTDTESHTLSFEL